jgi:hypothetical protein
MSDAIKALCKAQKEMGAVIKREDNPHLKKKYADLGAVMDACFDALHANGFAVMQPGGQDDYGTYVETVFAHETGEIFRSKVYLVIGKNDMQGVGSAWTYARRYGLLGMAGLAPEDDDGIATKRPRNDAPPPFDATAVYDRVKAAIGTQNTAETLDRLWAQANIKAALVQLSSAAQAELQAQYSDRMGEVAE